MRVCESRAYPVFNQSLGGSLPSCAISVTFAAWNFLLHADKKNNNPVLFLCRTAVRFPANSSHMCCVELALDRLLCTHFCSF